MVSTEPFKLIATLGVAMPTATLCVDPPSYKVPCRASQMAFPRRERGNEKGKNYISLRLDNADKLVVEGAVDIVPEAVEVGVDAE